MSCKQRTITKVGPRTFSGFQFELSSYQIRKRNPSPTPSAISSTSSATSHNSHNQQGQGHGQGQGHQVEKKVSSSSSGSGGNGSHLNSLSNPKFGKSLAPMCLFCLFFPAYEIRMPNPRRRKKEGEQSLPKAVGGIYGMSYGFSATEPKGRDLNSVWM